jgi:RimJ/RimL family protein N-acetyltransferase
MSREETAGFLAQVQDRYRKHGVCFWGVVRRVDRECLGICGILVQHIDGIDEYEIAYRILDTWWGQGYAPEAARGCIEYARDRLNARSVISLIRPVNSQSIRVAEKCGMHHEKDTVFHGAKHRVYRKDLKRPHSAQTPGGT